MGMPKGYRTNIKIVEGKIGPDRRQEILDGIADKGTFLPKSILEEDMDKAFVDFVGSEEGFSITIDGKKVPVLFLTIQRWSEFTKTWQFTDEYKNVEMPFVTVVRHPDIQQGKNQAGLWNIPKGRTYPYMKVPTWDGIRHGIDLYKIPQPTSVDMNYEVRLFANRMRDLNKLNRKIQKAFQSRQCYLDVNGHPIPLHLEGIGDESNIDTFDNRRFYVSKFDIQLIGYILDEEDFEVVPTVNRVITAIEIDEGKIYNNDVLDSLKEGHQLTYSFVWKPKADNQFTFNASYDFQITDLVNIENISRITIWVNNSTVFDGTVMNAPLSIYANDTIKIKVYKTQLTMGKFQLIGSTIA